MVHDVTSPIFQLQKQNRLLTKLFFPQYAKKIIQVGKKHYDLMIRLGSVTTY